MTAPVYIGLVHYPVVNKHGELVTTSITNFDLHDLARTCKTYGVEKCFIITPIEAQLKMMNYIREYWQEGFGSTYNRDRKEAFDPLEGCLSIEDSCLTIKNIHGTNPTLIATTARKTEKSCDFKHLRSWLNEHEGPAFILFGTGWGLAPEVFEKIDKVLNPICGPTNYNHLPVRAAVAIILDRLLAPVE